MRLFHRGMDHEENLFTLFISGLRSKGFDLIVFDKNQIKKHLGRGLLKTWEKSLKTLQYRKIIIIFNEKETRISWPSNNYPDRLVVNVARAPDKKTLLSTEKEMLDLLRLEKEIS